MTVCGDLNSYLYSILFVMSESETLNKKVNKDRKGEIRKRIEYVIIHIYNKPGYISSPYLYGIETDSISFNPTSLHIMKQSKRPRLKQQPFLPSELPWRNP